MTVIMKAVVATNIISFNVNSATLNLFIKIKPTC